jgi:hypothetical protein
MAKARNDLGVGQSRRRRKRGIKKCIAAVPNSSNKERQDDCYSFSSPHQGNIFCHHDCIQIVMSLHILER